jgi:hypothetical protein
MNATSWMGPYVNVSSFVYAIKHHRLLLGFTTIHTEGGGKKAFQHKKKYSSDEKQSIKKPLT